MLAASDGLVAYERSLGNERLMTALNLTANANPDRSGALSAHTLRPARGLGLKG